MPSDNGFDLTIIIISYNTRDLLKRCLDSLFRHLEGFKAEFIVVDNASKDGSPQMVAEHFPQIRLVASKINLGFAAANDLAFKLARGKVFVILNSDAFLHEGALSKAYARLKSNPKIAIVGGRIVGHDGSWQPSARQFPSLLNDFLHLSGLASKYPQSKFLGRADRTWQDPQVSGPTDWVPGAFAMISPKALEQVGVFDEGFFLYYEETDLCKRLKKYGYEIWYQADAVITHLGGESSKTNLSQHFSQSGSQLTLWRMRSQLLYYRKHQGWLGAFGIKCMEMGWHWLRFLKNRMQGNGEKAEDSRIRISLMRQAWKDTQGGSKSPPTPW